VTVTIEEASPEAVDLQIFVAGGGMGAEAHRKGPSALPGAADRGAGGHGGRIRGSASK
jgi:hypothetical protein